jgi:hypothetical protein
MVSRRRREVKPVGADGGIGIIDQHRLEEGVDGMRSVRGRKLWRALVVVGGDLGGNRGVHGLDGVGEVISSTIRSSYRSTGRCSCGRLLLPRSRDVRHGGSNEELRPSSESSSVESVDALGDLQDVVAVLGDHGVGRSWRAPRSWRDEAVVEKAQQIRLDCSRKRSPFS